MNKNHKLTVTPAHYPNGVRFIECKECNYALVAKVDEQGFIRPGSKIKINCGDVAASHIYTPQ